MKGETEIPIVISLEASLDLPVHSTFGNIGRAYEANFKTF